MDISVYVSYPAQFCILAVSSSMHPVAIRAQKVTTIVVNTYFESHGWEVVGYFLLDFHISSYKTLLDGLEFVIMV